jgi:hypothetical protein
MSYAGLPASMGKPKTIAAAPGYSRARTSELEQMWIDDAIAPRDYPRSC